MIKQGLQPQQEQWRQDLEVLSEIMRALCLDPLLAHTLIESKYTVALLLEIFGYNNQFLLKELKDLAPMSPADFARFSIAMAKLNRYIAMGRSQDVHLMAKKAVEEKIFDQSKSLYSFQTGNEQNQWSQETQEGVALGIENNDNLLMLDQNPQLQDYKELIRILLQRRYYQSLEEIESIVNERMQEAGFTMIQDVERVSEGKFIYRCQYSPQCQALLGFRQVQLNLKKKQQQLILFKLYKLKSFHNHRTLFGKQGVLSESQGEELDGGDQDCMPSPSRFNFNAQVQKPKGRGSRPKKADLALMESAKLLIGSFSKLPQKEVAQMLLSPQPHDPEPLIEAPPSVHDIPPVVQEEPPKPALSHSQSDKLDFYQGKAKLEIQKYLRFKPNTSNDITKQLLKIFKYDLVIQCKEDCSILFFSFQKQLREQMFATDTVYLLTDIRTKMQPIILILFVGLSPDGHFMLLAGSLVDLNTSGGAIDYQWLIQNYLEYFKQPSSMVIDFNLGLLSMLSSQWQGKTDVRLAKYNLVKGLEKKVAARKDIGDRQELLARIRQVVLERDERVLREMEGQFCQGADNELFREIQAVFQVVQEVEPIQASKQFQDSISSSHESILHSYEAQKHFNSIIKKILKKEGSNRLSEIIKAFDKYSVIEYDISLFENNKEIPNETYKGILINIENQFGPFIGQKIFLQIKEAITQQISYISSLSGFHFEYDRTKKQKVLVSDTSEILTCSCLQVENKGYPCSHILRILLYKDQLTFEELKKYISDSFALNTQQFEKRKQKALSVKELIRPEPEMDKLNPEENKSAKESGSEEQQPVIVDFRRKQRRIQASWIKEQNQSSIYDTFLTVFYNLYKKGYIDLKQLSEPCAQVLVKCSSMLDQSQFQQAQQSFLEHAYPIVAMSPRNQHVPQLELVHEFCRDLESFQFSFLVKQHCSECPFQHRSVDKTPLISSLNKYQLEKCNFKVLEAFMMNHTGAKVGPCKSCGASDSLITKRSVCNYPRLFFLMLDAVDELSFYFNIEREYSIVVEKEDGRSVSAKMMAEAIINFKRPYNYSAYCNEPHFRQSDILPNEQHKREGVKQCLDL